MKLLSEKEAKVISRKYHYENKEDNWFEKYIKHKEVLKQEGFRETNSKHVSNGKISTYVKYTSLGYDE